MTEGSRYLKCDAANCDAVFDRRPDGGTYRWGGQWQDIIADSKEAGWSWTGDPYDSRTEHFCPRHATPICTVCGKPAEGMVCEMALDKSDPRHRVIIGLS